MLVQPTHVATGGASGQPQHSSQASAIATKLADLRDELATGEVTTVQAASRLTALLATLSDQRTDTAMFSQPAFPRWTFGGYCTICLVYGCQKSECEEAVNRRSWAVCPDCKGSTYVDIEAGPLAMVRCDCFFGAVEVPPHLARLDRIALAEMCLNPKGTDCICEVHAILGRRPNVDRNTVEGPATAAAWPTDSNGRFVNSPSRSGL